MFEIGDIVSRLNDNRELEYGLCVSDMFWTDKVWENHKVQCICVVWANDKQELDSYSEIALLELVRPWNELAAILCTNQHCIDWLYRTSPQFNPASVK